MKKIFRMALVFALAGATLMYTGCTKDYSEDINNVEGEVSALESTINGLKQDVDALKSSVSALESAYKAADAALQKGIDANAAAIKGLQDKVAANESAIAKLEAASKTHATKDELEAAVKDLTAQIAANKAEILKVTDALQADVKALKEKLTADEATIAANAEAIKALQEAQAKIDEVYAALSNQLKSLVFIPDFYFAGIEATAFTTSNIAPIVALTDKIEFESNGTSFVLPKGAKSAWTAKVDAKKVPVSYVLSQLNVAKYAVNPSSYVPEEGVKWSFNTKDEAYITKADAKTWSVEAGDVTVKDGVASVPFTVKNPEYLIATVEDAFGLESEISEADTVGVIQLVAELGDDEKVVSDWEAIVPDQIQFGELAFAKGNPYKTVRTSCSIQNKDLYVDAQKALEALKDPEANFGGASVPVYYNCGEFDLSKLVNVHMIKGETKVEYTLAELVAKYPELAMNFELVDYTIGDNKTSESMYGKIDGKTFYPCYVKTGDKPSQELCGTDGKGKSSIGRFPLVLVTLTNAQDVVLSGYFVIEITEEELPTDKDVKVFDIKDFGSFPYICAAQKDSTTWHEFSDLVLESLNMNYDRFIKTYQIVTANGPVALEQGQSYDAQLFVKNVDKDGNDVYEIAYVLDDKGKATTTPVDFGKVTYSVDKKGNGVNDKFVWEITKAAAANIADGQDVYVLFQINEYSQIYFKFSAAIAAPAEITYGEINPAYWFSDVEEAQNTVRANVLVPNKTDDNVTVFAKDIDDYFLGNVLKVKLADKSKEVYDKYFDGKGNDDMTLTYAYSFAAEQPVIVDGENFWVLCTNGTVLYTAAVDANGKLLPVKKDSDKSLIDLTGNYLFNQPIASIDQATGVLTYYYDENPVISKILLNLWGKEETNSNKMLYANIQVDLAAGDPQTECVIAEASDIFHMRFIRPIDIVPASAKGLRDAVPGGDVIFLGDLLNAQDWNDNELDNIFQWHAKDPKATTAPENEDFFYADTYKTAAGSEIVWYKYYQFSKVKIDASKVETDQSGKFELLSGVNSAAKVYLATIENNAFKEIESGEATIGDPETKGDYQSIPDLMKYVLVYENNQGCVNDFKLKVPVTLTYAWGEISTEVIIDVDATYKGK